MSTLTVYGRLAALEAQVVEMKLTVDLLASLSVAKPPKETAQRDQLWASVAGFPLSPEEVRRIQSDLGSQPLAKPAVSDPSEIAQEPAEPGQPYVDRDGEPHVAPQPTIHASFRQAREQRMAGEAKRDAHLNPCHQGMDAYMPDDDSLGPY